ncbi:hypothetical protein [uncultured Enterovirga sp.]|uniref:hypothetical protein n=1 Tax=uncultured Enterovirga sp. TaxID=2026352 RepID=UPI0035C9A0C9
MTPLLVELAEATRAYPLTEAPAWRALRDEWGDVDVFAIESLPLTFDLTDASFAGRARVLADVYRASNGQREFVESRVIDARVFGRIETGGSPRIERFQFVDLAPRSH